MSCRSCGSPEPPRGKPNCDGSRGPFTYLQIYELLLGEDFDMFHVTAGMLLDSSVHKTYDALKWSLYLKVSAQSAQILCRFCEVDTDYGP
jgi:hypothetical protein